MPSPSTDELKKFIKHEAMQKLIEKKHLASKSEWIRIKEREKAQRKVTNAHHTFRTFRLNGKEMSDLETLPLYMQEFIREHSKEKNDRALLMEYIDQLFIRELQNVADDRFISNLLAYRDAYKLKSLMISLGVESMNRAIQRQMDLLESEFANPIIDSIKEDLQL